MLNAVSNCSRKAILVDASASVRPFTSLSHSHDVSRKTHLQ